MRTYKQEYQHWLDSPALSESEWAELNAIREDEKEIRERYGDRITSRLFGDFMAMQFTGKDIRLQKLS